MSQNTQRLGFVKPLAIFINHVGSGMRMAQRVDGSYKGSKLSLEGLRCVKNFCSPFQAISYFKITRSCAALRAADQGLSGQDALPFVFLQHVPSTLRLNGTLLIQKTSRDEHGTPTVLLWCKWESAHGVIQLTFMTQHEKVLIFRYLLTQGHNWPSWHRMRKCSFFVTYLHGVTTDLHDTEWESAHFSLLTYTGSQLTF